MINKKIVNILSEMTTDLNNNIRVLNENLINLNFHDENNQTLLHIFLNSKNDESKTILAIKTLIKIGRIDPNLKDDYGFNFIQTALLTGYSEEFILELIKLTLDNSERRLNVNSVDCNGNTIIHTAINSDNYKGGILSIFSLLVGNGFNYLKKNNYGETLISSMKFVSGENGKFTKRQFELLKKAIYDQNVMNFLEDNSEENIDYVSEEQFDMEEENIIFLSSEDVEKIEKLGKILNYKKYDTYPTVGRDIELENLIIGLASLKVSPLVVGEPGVGKTTLIDELVYRIINEQVPEFLKNKIIIEINPSELVAGTKYAGTFEEKVKELMSICVKYDAILFIDKIHKTRGTGTHDKSSVDMAAMLVPYMERENVKVIGTTTIEEYNEYFANSDLKDKFNVVKVEEPDDDNLYNIIEKTIIDYSLKTNISSYNILNEGKIIDLLIEVTSKKHRVYNDKVNNPKLVISIIDMAFAYAKAKGCKELTNEHFIKSLDICNRVYKIAKQGVVQKLNSSNNEIITSINKVNSKVLRIDFATKKRI